MCGCYLNLYSLLWLLFSQLCWSHAHAQYDFGDVCDCPPTPEGFLRGPRMYPCHPMSPLPFLSRLIVSSISPRTPKMFDCSTAHPCGNSIMRTSHGALRCRHLHENSHSHGRTTTKPYPPHQDSTRGESLDKESRSSCLLSNVSCVSDTKDLFDTWTKRARRTKDTIETGRFLGRKMSTIHSAQYSNGPYNNRHMNCL